MSQGVMVVGSEVPNLLEPDAAATLVISQGVDLIGSRYVVLVPAASPAGRPRSTPPATEGK
jgi:hypothetical protein